MHDNKDIFYIECQDGVKSVTIGCCGDGKVPMLFVGGNSSVHGYDCDGNEIFWTAVGDVVTSLILLDYDKDGLNEVEPYTLLIFIKYMACLVCNLHFWPKTDFLCFLLLHIQKYL